MKLFIAAGFIAASLAGCPVAAADINISGINFGAQNNAHATFGNIAIANGADSTATANGGIGNVVLASGASTATKTGPGSFNIVTAAGDSSDSSVVNGSFNLASSLNGGTARATNATGTFNAALGDDSQSRSTGIIGSVQTSFCGGTALSAQGRINVSAPCIGGN